MIQGISGLASISGRADAPPTPTGSPIVDQHGAALLAMGVAAALFDRTRTGRGQKIEVIMLRAALDLQLEVLTYYLNGGQMRKSATSLASMVHPGPYGVYRTKDSYLVLSSSPLPALQAALPPFASLDNPLDVTAQVLRDAGAKAIHVASTHGILCGSAVEKLKAAPIDTVVITDTVPRPPDEVMPKLKVLSVAPILGEAIKRIHRNESVSRLFVGAKR